MGMSAYSKCAICGKELADSNNEAYLLAQANCVGSNSGDGESRVSFDSSRKVLICKECIFDSIIAKKYPNLKINPGVTNSMRFYVRDGKTHLGIKPDKVLTESSTQDDVDKMLVEVARNMLKGKR